MTTKEPIRLLLVDDHPLVRLGLAGLIATQPDMSVVAEAANAHDAWELFRQHRPNVAIVDLQLPGLGGLDLIARLLRESPDLRVIVLTNHGGDEEIYRALRMGVKSYLLKDLPAETVLKAIRDAHRGERFVPPAVAERLVDRMTGMELTTRELDVLEEMAKGMSNKAIGATLGITEGTVKLHVKGILSKLGVSDRTAAVALAHKRGIINLG
jgi:two-component system NarL family response regulator